MSFSLALLMTIVCQSCDDDGPKRYETNTYTMNLAIDAPGVFSCSSVDVSREDIDATSYAHGTMMLPEYSPTLRFTLDPEKNSEFISIFYKVPTKGVATTVKFRTLSANGSVTDEKCGITITKISDYCVEVSGLPSDHDYYIDPSFKMEVSQKNGKVMDNPIRIPVSYTVVYAAPYEPSVEE